MFAFRASRALSGRVLSRSARHFFTQRNNNSKHICRSTSTVCGSWHGADRASLLRCRPQSRPALSLRRSSRIPFPSPDNAGQQQQRPLRTGSRAPHTGTERRNAALTPTPQSGSGPSARPRRPAVPSGRPRARNGRRTARPLRARRGEEPGARPAGPSRP